MRHLRNTTLKNDLINGILGIEIIILQVVNSEACPDMNLAKFMSGHASLFTTCKIIISMPKIPFIKSFFNVVFRKCLILH